MLAVAAVIEEQLLGLVAPPMPARRYELRAVPCRPEWIIVLAGPCCRSIASLESSATFALRRAVSD